MDGKGAGQTPIIDIYARISRAPNGQVIKTDFQVEVCSGELAGRGARVGRVFVDPSLSAWKPNVVRPDWDKMMARLEAGESDGVMFYDVTRYSRKIIEGERLVEMAARGLRVWSLTGEYDLAKADGRRHFRDDMVAAAGESDKMSERVRDGKLRRARKGRLAGGARPWGMPGWAPAPPGWEPGDPREMVPEAVVEAERADIRECYRRLLGGELLVSVERDLYGRGIVSVNGKPFTRQGLTRSLLRPSLAGVVVLRGTEIALLAGSEPVVGREDWERLCGILAGRLRGRPPGGPHLLSGLWVCGRCGHKMFGVTRAQLAPYADGPPRREYRCRKDSSHHGCGRNVIDAARAEQVAAEAVKARLGDPRRAERVAARLASVRGRRAELEAELTHLNDAADNLAVKTGTWGIDRVDAAMGPILKRVAELEAERGVLEFPEDAHAAAADAAAAWDEAAAEGDQATLRAMVRRAFPALVLAPPAGYADRSLGRFVWDGPRPAIA